MVHGSLTRSGWYSLFLLTGNGKRYPLPSLAGKGYPLPTGRERDGCCDIIWLLNVHHLPVICNVRLAGDRNWRCCRFGCRRCGWRCEVGNPGTLVSPGRGNGTDFTDAVTVTGGRSLPSR